METPPGKGGASKKRSIRKEVREMKLGILTILLNKDGPVKSRQRRPGSARSGPGGGEYMHPG